MDGSLIAFSPAVVAPTFNNAPTLRDMVERIAQHRLPIFVVNDGSDDATPQILAELERAFGVHVVTHLVNRGKAAAMYSGFAAASAAGYSHAITIDTDGQLDPGEMPRLLDAARENPRALILGTRDASAADYPSRSRTGRRISNFFICLESGLRVSDSQCGFRVYPLGLVQHIPCRAARYGLETEFLTRAAWAGCQVVEVGVSCRYFTHTERITHFQPWRDTFRAVGMHARLVGRALVPVPHAKWCDTDAAKRPSRGRAFIDWINPLRAWRELREERLAPQELSAGVAVGVFIGNLPLFGVHTLLSLYTARRLHLHPVAVVAGSHVSTPPLGPALIAAAIALGHWLLHGRWMFLPGWQSTWRGWARVAGTWMLEWSIGSVLIGLTLAILAFFLSTILLRYVAVAARD